MKVFKFLLFLAFKELFFAFWAKIWRIFSRRGRNFFKIRKEYTPLARNGIKRLGKKDGPGIRLIRVVFETEEDRDYAIRYAWLLKYDEKYRNRISLKKDLIKDDRRENIGLGEVGKVFVAIKSF